MTEEMFQEDLVGSGDEKFGSVPKAGTGWE